MKFIYIAPLLLLVPAVAGAQTYYYEGTLTFRVLTGKDCGETKVGDTRTLQLVVTSSGKQISGYTLVQGGLPGRYSGEQVDRLVLEYPDPQQATGHAIALNGIGAAALTGEVREKSLQPNEPGCNFSRAEIAAQQMADGAKADELQTQFVNTFQAYQIEIAAQQRDPQSYAEQQLILPELAKAEAEGSEQPQEALRLRERQQPLLEKTFGLESSVTLDNMHKRAKLLEKIGQGNPSHPNADYSAALQLREQLQPLYAKVFGADSQQSLNNLAARAQLHERLKQFEPALALRHQALAIAQKKFPQQIAAAAYNVGDVLEKLDRKQEAANAFALAAQADEKQFGADSSDVADDLQREAKLLEALQRNQQALEIYRRILAIREKILGSEHVDTAQALNNLAGLYDTLGQYDQALPMYLRALTICEKTFGPEHAYTATLLNNLALLYKNLGQHDKALPLYQRALTIREKVPGPDHATTATSLNNLARLYDDLGQYDKALPLHQRALAIREKVLGPEHADTAQSLNNLALVYESLGQYEQALALYQRALTIREKVLGPEHTDTAQSLNNLAGLYKTLGQYDQALPLYQRALAIREKVLGQEHTDIAQSLNNLAEFYRIIGQYNKALPLYQRALTIREKVLGPEHADTAIILNNLAMLYRILGQSDQALPLYQRALAIYEKALGPEHEYTAIGLSNLALLYQTSGQYDQALPMLKRSLAIKEKVFGSENTHTAIGLNNLGFLYFDLGQYDQALPLYQRALTITEKALGPEHADTAISLNNLATLYQMLGQYDQALPLYQRALTISEKTLGQEHADTASSLDNLASLLAVQHKSNEALNLFARSQRIVDHIIDRTFPILTEQQKLQFVQMQEASYHAMLSFIHRQLPTNAAAIRAGLDLVLSRKGIVFDAQARQQEAIARSLDPDTKMIWDDLAAQRAQFSKLLQNKPEKMSSEDYQAKLKQYQGAIAQLEAKIASKSALVAEEFKQRKLTSKEVAQSLGKDAALIEFVKIRDYDWDQGIRGNTWRYLAFILKGDGTVKLVDLGNAEALEKSVQPAIAALSEIRNKEAEQKTASQTLDAKLWQPLAAAVGEAAKVVFSPDGLLNLVPFAAMQDTDGSYLIERKQVIYVTSGRDLAKGDTGIKPELDLYLAANPRFDLQSAAQSSDLASTNSATRSGGFTMQFGPLPGTEKEAQQVPGYLKGRQTIVIGKDATEDSVLTMKRPKVLHLATHGFFLQDQIGLSEGTRGATRIKTDQPVALPKNYENPLVRSGLALAGANHASEAQGERDGLLTALEVSGMDLHGTELVTLSACETGRGDVKSGEGVFGLRRAFALAGAKNLIMSLWPVSDAVTAQQMQRLYREYGQGKSPAQALRQAQLATIADLRNKKGYASPALWAPFIVQGR